MDGWISLHRKIINHPDYFSEKFTRMSAWIDLLLLANHSTGYIRKRGIKVEIQRGQTAVSRDKLAERWQWSHGKVTRFLDELENDGQIVQQKNNVINCITVCNYDVYQINDTANNTTDDAANDTADSTANETPNEPQTETNNKNNKNITNNKKNITNNKKKETPPKGGVKKEKVFLSSTHPEYTEFNEWIKINTPYCANPAHMPHQITEEEFIKLRKRFTREQIQDIISQIENRKDLRKKYSNLYRTALNWLNKEPEKEKCKPPIIGSGLKIISGD